MFNKYYQPSKKFPVVGFILLIAVFVVVGSAVAWVYLWFNRICTSPILCVFAAIGYGALMGFLGKLIVKKCKIHNPAAALIGIIIGVLGMTYIKWGLYDYKLWLEDEDYYAETISNGDLEYEMKNKTAYDWFKLDYYFNEVDYTFEENWEYVQGNAYETAVLDALWAGVDINDYYTKEEQDEMKDYTVYEYYGLDVILGETKEECKANVALTREMDAYEYLTDHMGISLEERYGETFTAPTLLEVLGDPAMLWDDIKYINDVGMWTYTSSSYGQETTSDPVNGVALWIVWIGEFLIIDLFAIIISYSQSKHIFIESDNNWAEVYDSNKFTFANMSKMQLKSMLEQSADNIANLAPVDPVKLIGRPYVKLTISHSRDYSENYLNGYVMTYNPQSKGYAAGEAFKGLVITPKQAGVLFSMFGIEPMGRIANDPEFVSWRNSGGTMGGGYAQPAMQQPTATAAPVTMDAPLATCGSCGAQVPAGKKFCPHCGAPFESAQQSDLGFDRRSFEAWRNAGGSSSRSSDEMDGISTDDIDTTNL